ncbi:hypothetical protein ACSVDE_17135 [Pseudalkalibacillus sp. Hm43]|uniref:hypothetical protein n=1 Tax=Pseudalkalibacillus sp. Hm43 TaxID=3450742 RepID=UPI003F437619
MGIYQKVCYKVEDTFVKMLTKKSDQNVIKEKVETYRAEKEEEKAKKKAEAQAKREQTLKEQEERKAREEKEVLSILYKLVDVHQLEYTDYEFNEVKRNKARFLNILNTIFEKDEKGLSFIHCEFDKSSKKEMKGYLIATNKRVWFVADHSDYQQKFRYQTIKDVKWFKDGVLERGFKIQYGVKKLEFDEIFDQKQLKRFGDLVLNLSNQYS